MNSDNHQQIKDLKPRKLVQDLIRDTSGNRSLILASPVLALFFDGDLNAAILTNQILYWMERTTDRDGWFYKRNQDWYDETTFSEYQLRRVIEGDPRVKNPKRNLTDVGLETKITFARDGKIAKHYRLDLTQFFSMFVDWLEENFSKLPQNMQQMVNKATQSIKKFGKGKQNAQQPAKNDSIWMNDYYVPGTNMYPHLDKPTLQPSERVNTPWKFGDTDDKTIQDAWSLARHQLDLRFNPAIFTTYIENLQLVDFDPATRTFTLAAETDTIADMVRHRLYREIRAVTAMSYGENIELAVVTFNQWEQQRE